MTIDGFNMNINGWKVSAIRGFMDMPSRTDEAFRDWGTYYEAMDILNDQEYAPRNYSIDLIYDTRIGGLSYNGAVNWLVDRFESSTQVNAQGSSNPLFNRQSDLLGIEVFGKENDPAKLLRLSLRQREVNWYFFNISSQGDTGYKITSIYGTHDFETWRVKVLQIFDEENFQGYQQKDIRTLEGNQEYSTKKGPKYITVRCAMGNGRFSSMHDFNSTLSYLTWFQRRLRHLPTSSGAIMLNGTTYNNAIVEKGFKVNHLKWGVITFDITFTILP